MTRVLARRVRGNGRGAAEIEEHLASDDDLGRVRHRWIRASDPGLPDADPLHARNDSTKRLFDTIERFVEAELDRGERDSGVGPVIVDVGREIIAVRCGGDAFRIELVEGQGATTSSSRGA